MVGHRSGDGGSANMPPFPPLHATGSNAEPEEPTVQSADPSPGAAPPAEDPQPTEPTPAEAGSLPGSRGFQPDDEPDRISHRAAARLRHRTEAALRRGLDGLSHRLEDAAEQIARVADDRLGGSPARERAVEVAHSAAARLDDLADYLRNADSDRLRRDLERQVREKPVHSILVAVASGWVLGKIVR